MADIINLTDKLKDKQKEPPEFYKRFANCYKNQIEKGICECELCKNKAEMATKLIDYGNNLAIEIMKKGGPTIYFGDILEVFIISSLKLKDFCQKEIPNGKK